MLIEVTMCMLKAFFLSLPFIVLGIDKVILKSNEHYFWKNSRDFLRAVKDVLRKHAKYIIVYFIRWYIIMFSVFFLVQHFVGERPEQMLWHCVFFDIFISSLCLLFYVFVLFTTHRIQNVVVLDIKTGEIVFCDSRKLSCDVRKFLWKFRINDLSFLRESVEEMENSTGENINHAYLFMVFKNTGQCISFPYFDDVKPILSELAHNGSVSVCGCNTVRDKDGGIKIEV